MLSQLVITGLQGVVKGIGERLGQGRTNSVTIRALTKDIEMLKELRQADRADLNALIYLLRQLVDRTDGLEMRNERTIVFVPTDMTPDALTAVMNLTRQADGLLAGAPPTAPARPRPPGPGHAEGPAAIEQARQADPSSIFYRLDEEIARLRREPGPR